MCEVGRVVGLGDVRKVVQLAVGGGDHRAGLADQVGQQLVGGDRTPQDGEERLPPTREQRRNPLISGKGEW